MKKKDLLTLLDLSCEEGEKLLLRTKELKEKQARGIPHLSLKGKNIGLLFKKSSTRTRVSFEVAVSQLGGHSLFFSSDESQLGRGETIADTARVLSRYVNGLVIRTYHQEEVEEWARWASVPVINGLTDLHHPCQVLSDLFTIMEKKGRLAGVRVAYIGDGNNVAHSLIEGCALMGVHLSCATPPGFEPREEIVRRAEEVAIRSGTRIAITTSPEEAASEADILYTDTWVSMGQEKEAAKRARAFHRYRIDSTLLARAKPDAYVMHCLPAHRGEEITDEVMEGSRSIIFDQAENRLHTQKALLEMLLGEK